jgi:hypothetical protein
MFNRLTCFCLDVRVFGSRDSLKIIWAVKDGSMEIMHGNFPLPVRSLGCYGNEDSKNIPEIMKTYG